MLIGILCSLIKRANVIKKPFTMGTQRIPEWSIEKKKRIFVCHMAVRRKIEEKIKHFVYTYFYNIC